MVIKRYLFLLAKIKVFTRIWGGRELYACTNGLLSSFHTFGNRKMMCRKLSKEQIASYKTQATHHFSYSEKTGRKLRSLRNFK